jgi:hypothetical protein
VRLIALPWSSGSTIPRWPSCRLTSETTWTVSGSVNHFGHVHYRQNRYVAALHIIAVEGVWKVTGIELIGEKRLL